MSAEQNPFFCTYSLASSCVKDFQSGILSGFRALTKSKRSPTPFNTWNAKTSKS